MKRKDKKQKKRKEEEVEEERSMVVESKVVVERQKLNIKWKKTGFSNKLDGVFNTTISLHPVSKPAPATYNTEKTTATF